MTGGAGRERRAVSRAGATVEWIGGERGARIAFLVILAAAVPIVLLWAGSFHWFFRDDFMFLTERRATSLDDLFRPHVNHWSTVPLLVFRGLWSVFGLRTYVPYQAAAVALHLTACWLLWVVTRRAAVGPWVATAVASTFVLFGPGQQNIIWAFGISFTASLVFGLGQLILSDHDGPIDWRDGLGVAAGILSLMSSGVGVAMAVTTGIAVLGRRGWKVAALHVAPLAAAFLAWYLIEDPQLETVFGRPTVEVMWNWLKTAETGYFRALGHFQWLAVFLGAVMVVGLVLAWSRLDFATLRRRASTPFALLVGAAVFAVFTSISRWWLGYGLARQSRYLHIGVAMMLPALAVALDAIVRRSRPIGVAAIGLLLLAIPWNATGFESATVFGEQYMDSRRRVITNVTRVPEARRVPRDVRPIADPFLGTELTIGFLLDLVDEGKLDPGTAPMSPALRNELALRLVVAQGSDGVIGDCETVSGPKAVSPRKGQMFGITTPVTIAFRGESGPEPGVVALYPLDGGFLTVELADRDLTFSPAAGAASFNLCAATPGPSPP
jgi:hypothetical protein